MQGRLANSAIVAGLLLFVAMTVIAAFKNTEFLRVALPGYLTAIGTFALAGVTVWLSQREAKAAERARSHAAAFALARSIGEAWHVIAATAPGERIRVEKWFLDVALNNPDILDLEMMRRVDVVSNRIAELDDWSVDLRGPAGVVTRDAEEFDERRLALKRDISWLGESLASFRNGKPLPPEPSRVMS